MSVEIGAQLNIVIYVLYNRTVPCNALGPVQC